jgi:lipopolysaccharide/colanic/teichoic acid biosynthesis glycosyltransferase
VFDHQAPFGVNACMIASRPDYAAVSLRYSCPVLETTLTGYAGEGVTVWADDEGDELLDERFREIVGLGWVSEVVVGPEAPLPLTQRLVALASEIGRPIRLVGIGSVGDISTPSPEQRWIREAIDGQTTWVLTRSAWPIWQIVLKRTLDLWLGMLLTVALLPLLIMLTLAVRLSSPGPILYRWNVLGRYGRPFTGYKFRTMVENADTLKAQLMASNDMSGPVFKMTRDPRVTSIGRWLRKYSLDELPQLWSVIKGDMSLVGPRPTFRSEYERFELWQMRKLSVVPGITCLWQSSGRNAIRDFSEWARLDLEYIDHWSLWLDVKILVWTVRAVLGGTGH